MRACPPQQVPGVAADEAARHRERAARRLLVTRTGDLARLTTGFDRLADVTSPARADPVITHGEPHPANLMSVGGRLMLID